MCAWSYANLAWALPVVLTSGPGATDPRHSTRLSSGPPSLAPAVGPRPVLDPLHHLDRLGRHDRAAFAARALAAPWMGGRSLDTERALRVGSCVSRKPCPNGSSCAGIGGVKGQRIRR